MQLRLRLRMMVILTRGVMLLVVVEVVAQCR